MAVKRNRNNLKTGYGLGAPLLNLSPLPIVSQRAPTANDTAEIGTTWIDQPNDDAYIITSIAAGAAVWINTGGGGGIFTTITVNPGDINVTAGDVVVAAGDITATTGNIIAGADISATGFLYAGQDFEMASGTCTITSDTDGALAIYLHTDAGTAETIDIHADQGTGAGSINIHSDVGGILVDSGLAQPDAINISSSDAAGGISMTAGTGGISIDITNGQFDLETGTGAINIGTDAAAKTITIGNNTTTTAIDLFSGTGDIDINSADVMRLDATGSIQINSSAAGIFIGQDDIDFQINIGTAGERPITIGNVVGVTGVTIDAGVTNGINLNASGKTVIQPATTTVASPTATAVLNVNVGGATFTGFTTASAATQTFTITNSLVSATSVLIVNAANEGANAAYMTVERVLRGAGTFDVVVRNNGAAALNGNVTISFIVMS